jgi:hypothetical protein
MQMKTHMRAGASLTVEYQLLGSTNTNTRDCDSGDILTIKPNGTAAMELSCGSFRDSASLIKSVSSR